MLNLRSLDSAGTQAASSTRHFSRFSAPNFRMPESINLGNIGEDLSPGDRDSAAMTSYIEDPGLRDDKFKQEVADDWNVHRSTPQMGNSTTAASPGTPRWNDIEEES